MIRGTKGFDNLTSYMCWVGSGEVSRSLFSALVTLTGEVA